VTKNAAFLVDLSGFTELILFMYRFFVFAILLATFAAGCKKEESPPPQPGPAAAAPNQQIAPATSSPSVVPPSAPKAPDLNALTLSLHHWIMRNQRHPANFEEFAADADIPIPPAPSGRKYAIDKSMSVILVKQ
jgi:hypothetical protein